MNSDYAPLPIRKEDRLHVATVPGFLFCEALHPPLTLPPHVHERANLTVLLKGVFRESYARSIADCAPSSLLFRPAGEKHSDQFGREGAHNLSIEVSESRLELIRQYASGGEAIWHFHDERVGLIGRRICRELRNADTATPIALESLALELLAFSARRLRSLYDTGRTPAWLLNVRDLLHDRFGEGLRLGAIAEDAGVHPVYLARAFRSYFHCTLGEYLRRLRIDWAMSQLATSETTIVEIAQQSGFADQSHFTRVFKQQTGFTPGQFRFAQSGRQFPRKSPGGEL